jgi:hypothetical protein
MNTKVINLISWDNFEQKLIWSLFAIMIALVGLYIYLVNISVFNIMARKEAEERISQIATEVAKLEATYIGLSSKIDMETAYALGFKDASKDGSYADLVATRLSYQER